MWNVERGAAEREGQSYGWVCSKKRGIKKDRVATPVIPWAMITPGTSFDGREDLHSNPTH